MNLAPCPCGETPKALGTEPSGEGSKWAYAYGGCCGVWQITLPTDHEPLDSAECYRLACEQWNAMPRGADVQPRCQ